MKANGTGARIGPEVVAALAVEAEAGYDLEQAAPVRVVISSQHEADKVAELSPALRRQSDPYITSLLAHLPEGWGLLSWGTEDG